MKKILLTLCLMTFLIMGTISIHAYPYGVPSEGDSYNPPITYSLPDEC